MTIHTSDGSCERAVTPKIEQLVARCIWVLYTFLVAALALNVTDEKHCKETSLKVKISVSEYDRTEGRQSRPKTFLNRVLVVLHMVKRAEEES
jgi:hypothetical protein